MFQIRDILVRIRTADLRIRIRILLFSSVTLMPTNNYVVAYYFLKVHLHHFSKIKSNTEVTKQVFLTILVLLLDDEKRIRIRNSDYWIRIREAQKVTDSDPKHCL